MTVETEDLNGDPIVLSGPYNGNGVTATFDYDFPITAETEVRATRRNADGTETELVLTTDYTVAGVGDPAGGSITLVDPATDLPTGAQLVLRLSMDFNQSTDYSNQGRIQLAILEASLDRLTLMARQLREEVLRAVTVDAFGATDIATLRTNLNILAALDTELAALAAIAANITTVAGIAANVTTVAGIAANVTTVAGIAANVTTVAGIAADVSAVAAISADIQTCADNIAEIQLAASFVPSNFVTLTGAQTISGAKTIGAALTFGDAVTGDVQIIGTDNVSRLLNFSGGRTKVGFNGANATLQGGAGRGVLLQVNGATNALVIDSSAQVTGDVLASQAEAEAGTAANKLMTPERVAQAIAALAPTNDWIVVGPTTVSSGTAADFTGLPAGLSEIEIILSGLDTNTAAALLLQLGDAGGIEATGYSGAMGSAPASSWTVSTSTDSPRHGVFRLIRGAGHQWALAVTLFSDAGVAGGGVKTLSDELTQFRLSAGGASFAGSGTVTLRYR